MTSIPRSEVDPELDPDTSRPAAVCKFSSQYRGVCWSRKSGKWQAAINIGGSNLYLGSCKDEDEAARLFDRAAVRINRRKLNFKWVGR